MHSGVVGCNSLCILPSSAVHGLESFYSQQLLFLPSLSFFCWKETAKVYAICAHRSLSPSASTPCPNSSVLQNKFCRIQKTPNISVKPVTIQLIFVMKVADKGRISKHRINNRFKGLKFLQLLTLHFLARQLFYVSSNNYNNVCYEAMHYRTFQSCLRILLQINRIKANMITKDCLLPGSFTSMK